MRLFSYIVTHDTGFAPNPFWGICSLANCKPTIRRTAEIGDWIVGLSSKELGHQIIYAMRVNQIISYEEYFSDNQYKKKIPDFSIDGTVNKCGDNIYMPLGKKNFQQLQSMHSLKRSKIEDPKSKKHDLGGKNVLLSKDFYYFGSKKVVLPESLNELIVGRAHKCRFNKEIIESFCSYISHMIRE
jgi:hypothetical protein